MRGSDLLSHLRGEEDDTEDMLAFLKNNIVRSMLSSYDH